jgi:hypothetical protein
LKRIFKKKSKNTELSGHPFVFRFLLLTPTQNCKYEGRPIFPHISHLISLKPEQNAPAFWIRVNPLVEIRII